MTQNNIKLLMIKKARDIYFLLKYGKGNFLLIYIKTLIYYFTKKILLKKKINDLKKIKYGNFTNSWFDDNIDYLIIYFLEEKDKIREMLEIGSFEGNSTLFFLNFFSNSNIKCVDIWEDQKNNYGETNFQSIEKKFNDNISNYLHRLEKYKLPSNIFFKNEKKLNYFDLIFIDGSHYHKHVYADAINAFKSCKISGYILFDDYLFKYKTKNNSHPIFAINKFLKKYKKKIKIIAVHRQVLIKKLSN